MVEKQRRGKNGNPLGRLCVTLMIVVVCFIMSISMVSAFEFDNIKSYDEKTRTATIVNAFGLGSDLAYVTLTSPMHVKVGAGEDVLVGEFNITTTGNFMEVFGELYLTNMKNGNEMSRGKQYKYKKYTEKKVDTFETICEIRASINGTIEQVCEEVENGTKIVTQMDWKPILNPNEIFYARATYEIGVFVDVELNDWGDWKPEILGVEIPEWATWEADLFTGMVSYYQLSETSGAVVDIHGTNNGTNVGATRGVTGKIGNGFDYDKTQGSYGGHFTIPTINLNDFTINLWINPDENFGTLSNTLFSLKDSSGSTTDRLWFDPVIKLDVDGISYNTGFTPSNHIGIWKMYTFTRVGSNFEIFINEISVDNSTTTSNTFSISSFFGKVNTATGVASFDGQGDEVGIWTRPLTTEEIEFLYNNGTGVAYGDDGISPPLITLNSPSSTNYTTLQDLVINFTASDGIKLDNVTLYVNDVLNQTNTSGINNTDYLFNLSLGDGTYEIYGTATNNESQSANSSTITIIINTTPNIQFQSPTQINNYNSTSPYIPINVSLTETYFQNITFNVNGTEYTYTDDTRFINNSYPDGSYNYNVTTCTTTDKCNTTETRTINIDATLPTINVTHPSGDLGIFVLGDNETLNWTVTDANLDSCWYVYPDETYVEKNNTNIIFQDGFFNESVFDNWLFNNTQVSQSAGSQNSNYEAESTFEVWGVTSGQSMPIYLEVANYQTSFASSNDGTWIRQLNLSFFNYVNNTYDIIESNIRTSNPGAGTTYVEINYTGTLEEVYINNRVLTAKVYLERYDSKPSALAVGQSTLYLNQSNIEDLDVANKTYINCSLNTTEFEYIEGVNGLTFYANDTFGNINSQSTEWNYQLVEVSQTYPASSYETETEPYTINLTYNSSKYNIITGMLHVNGNEYTGTRTGTGNDAIFSANAIMPSVDAETNLTAYWNIELTDVIGTTAYNSTSNNVTVEIINFSLCDANNNVSFWNYTVLNESNGAEINATFEGTFTIRLSGSTEENVFSFEDTSGDNSQFDFCISPGTKSYSIDTNIKLTKSGFVDKFYNYEEVTVTNATREDNLYMLAVGDSTSYIIHVVDVSGSNVEDAEVRVQRYYTGTDEWVTTEIVTTNYIGEAVGHLLSEDADYRFKVYQSGVSTYNSSATKIICAVSPCTVTLVIPIELLTGYEEVENLVSSLTYSDTTNIFSYSYSDTSGTFSQARLYVLRVFPSGATLVAPCNETKTGSAGVMTCDISSNVNGTYRASAYITRADGEFLDRRIDGVRGTNIYNSIGLDGVLWSIFILIGIVMLGVERPSLAIIFGTLGLFLLSLLQIINIGAISLVAITAVAFILLMRVGRE